MLSQLSVRHLAVVEDISLQFKSGMTSLTGETGAGKSMLVDALSLALGDRADSNMVRHGAERAEIEAVFDLSDNQALLTWLKEQELDDDDQCQLRRTISRDGRSKGYINGRQVPLNQLKQIGELSLDIHGQHAHQSLLRADTQRELVDIVAGNKVLLKQLRQQYRDWQQHQQQLTDLQNQSAQSEARLELLQYQVSEMAEFALTDQKIQDCLQQQQQLANAAELMQSSENALQTIFDQESGAAYDLIGIAVRDLEKLQDVEPRFAGIIETLNSALINLDESASSLRHYLDHSELDPQQLDQVERELSQLNDLARKHHVDIEQLPAHFHALSAELESLSSASQNLGTLEKQVTADQKACLDLCHQIRERRQACLKDLSSQITASIQQLAMPAGKVEFILTPYPDNEFAEHGADQLQLKVTTNPGQPAGDLAKIASGGELARISLAIQVVTAGQRTVPTLIFDEVDVGIGGGVAEIVGQHLRLLASSQQVICVTHLPQVAAQAHQQLQVSKKLTADNTHIEIQELDRPQRVEEIARMLGGMQLTQTTRLHAEEMLDQAQQV
ncbi:MAG TPA: DNA repair protein RecN [Methylophaga sp.]|nr:DNA repair protein RecN [Methylophaga sp.]